MLTPRWLAGSFLYRNDSKNDSWYVILQYHLTYIRYTLLSASSLVPSSNVTLSRRCPGTSGGRLSWSWLPDRGLVPNLDVEPNPNALVGVKICAWMWKFKEGLGVEEEREKAHFHIWMDWKERNRGNCESRKSKFFWPTAQNCIPLSSPSPDTKSGSPTKRDSMEILFFSPKNLHSHSNTHAFFGILGHLIPENSIVSSKIT